MRKPPANPAATYVFSTAKALTWNKIQLLGFDYKQKAYGRTIHFNILWLLCKVSREKDKLFIIF